MEDAAAKKISQLVPKDQEAVLAACASGGMLEQPSPALPASAGKSPGGRLMSSTCARAGISLLQGHTVLWALPWQGAGAG